MALMGVYNVIFFLSSLFIKDRNGERSSCQAVFPSVNYTSHTLSLQYCETFPIDTSDRLIGSCLTALIGNHVTLSGTF